MIGDGESHLLKLIEKKNQVRDAGVAELVPDEKMAWFLTRQLTFDGRISNVPLIREGKGGFVSNPWKLTYRNDWDKSVFEYIPKK